MTTYTELDGKIRADLKSLGEHLEQMQREELYKARFKTFRAYLASLDVPNRTLYRHIQRYVTERDLCQTGMDLALTKTQVDALSEVHPDYRRPVIDLAVAVTRTLEDTLTAKRIERVAGVMYEASLTGAADIGDGKSTLLTASILQNEVEAIERKAQHIRDSGRRVYHGKAQAARVFGRTLQLPDQIELPDGQEVMVSFWTEESESEVEHET